MKTISKLLDSTTRRLYIRFESSEECIGFLEQAEREGFTFGHKSPTDAHPSDLIVVGRNKNLSYVGTVGRIAQASKEVLVINYSEL